MFPVHFVCGDCYIIYIIFSFSSGSLDLSQVHLAKTCFAHDCKDCCLYAWVKHQENVAIPVFQETHGCSLFSNPKPNQTH